MDAGWAFARALAAPTLAAPTLAAPTLAAPTPADDRCAIRYRLTDLGTLGGGYSYSEGMNNRGQVVGYSGNADGAPHAFLWTPGRGMRDLTPASDIGVAGKVNDRGQVVLNRLQPDGTSEAVLWSPFGRRTWILPTLGGERTAASGLNNRGQVVGWSDLANGDQHAFLWSPGAALLRDLGTLGGTQSAATAINAFGVVVGHSNAPAGPEHAFRWSPLSQSMHDLGSVGAAYSEAEDINERGEVAGRIAADGISRAVVWSWQTGLRRLGTLGGTQSYATGINNRRQIVGWSTIRPQRGFIDGPEHAFLVSPGCGMRDLNRLLEGAGEITLSYASAINDRGQIAADGVKGEVTRAYRLEPVRHRTDAMDAPAR